MWRSCLAPYEIACFVTTSWPYFIYSEFTVLDYSQIKELPFHAMQAALAADIQEWAKNSEEWVNQLYQANCLKDHTTKDGSIRLSKKDAMELARKALMGTSGTRWYEGESTPEEYVEELLGKISGESCQRK